MEFAPREFQSAPLLFLPTWTLEREDSSNNVAKHANNILSLSLSLTFRQKEAPLYRDWVHFPALFREGSWNFIRKNNIKGLKLRPSFTLKTKRINTPFVQTEQQH